MTAYLHEIPTSRNEDALAAIMHDHVAELRAEVLRLTEDSQRLLCTPQACLQGF